MSKYVIYNGELYHYGIKGQKWGRRRYQNPDGTLTPAGKKRMAKKEYERAATDASAAYLNEAWKGATTFGLISRTRKYEEANKKANEAFVNATNKKAEYDVAKAKTQEKANKAEFKSYVKSMGASGIAGGLLDRYNGGRSRAIYDDLMVKKGQAYADKVHKKVQNQTIAKIAGGVAATVGLTVAKRLLFRKLVNYVISQ